jgi:hypothetical protein
MPGVITPRTAFGRRSGSVLTGTVLTGTVLTGTATGLSSTGVHTARFPGVDIMARTLVIAQSGFRIAAVVAGQLRVPANTGGLCRADGGVRLSHRVD